MARSAALIFNPVAGQGNPDQDLALIRELLEPEITLEICLTSEEVGAQQLADEAVKRGAQAIIASGGDGTLSAAATALIGTSVPLGIISRGTANAFANALGIADTIEAACHTILEGTTRTIDVAQCNGMPLILLAGIGFEAETVEGADRQSKKRFGMAAYILAGLTQLQNLHLFETRIETEDKIITVEAAAVTVANAAPATSVLAQGPASVIFDDGLLDMTIIAPKTVLGAIATSYELLQSTLSGNAAERDEVGYLRAKRFKIDTTPPQKVVLDGELIGTTPVDIECIPGGLTVFFPSVEEESPVEKLEGLPNLTVELKPSAEL